MTSTRRRFKQTTTLQRRLAAFADQARSKASLLPPGTEKQEQLGKARQADRASFLDDCIRLRHGIPK